MKKQAVIVAHGMGEQRPMGTLRGLVESLAETKKAYVIPDQATGSSELSRMRVSATMGASDGIVTDFYELYYADLLGTGSFSQLRSWIVGLLLRWPHQVPHEVWKIWVFLWAIILFSAWWLGPLLADNPTGKLQDLVKVSVSSGNDPTLIQRFIVVIVSLLSALKLALMAKAHVASKNTKPDEKRSLSTIWSYVLPVIAGIVIAYVMWNALPWKALQWPAVVFPPNAGVICKIWTTVVTFLFLPWVKLLVAAVIWYGVSKFGVSYFGDVARYLDTNHGAIASRSAIRERAVTLLATLHERRSFEEGSKTDAPEYERIIVLAHSLGSVVAYDAMRIYWAQTNNDQRRVFAGNLAKKAQEMADKIAELPAVGDAPKDLNKWNDEYDTMQGEAFNLLDANKSEWRISDFVTLGSPLARADFLMSRDMPRFRKNTAERIFPTSPPVLEDKSFLHHSGKAGGKIPHHAAMFVVTKWLAVFDPVRGFLFGGDFIGGPVRYLFGTAISELAVKISRKSKFLPGAFTHTDYWDPSVKVSLDSEKTHVPNNFSKQTGDGQVVLNVLRNIIWPH